ncbi:hypothetical protein GCM10007049_13550 [Echinicola pacifica]|uniref:UspA domain-containing protein n=1 Tax=Echinicola pacifica TaxID=346377 RepID=A0A918PVA4_9BACT|nr:universal stress protein [Echinicola pacifica]GGZ22057.1 hypothetical protein GCM10007049_13550 [Echinicola pacifica]
MKNLKKIAVCVDLTDMDSILLNYIKIMHDVFQFESLTLLHLIELEELSDESSALISGLGKSISQMLEAEIDEIVKDHLHDTREHISIHVHSGGDVEDFADFIDRQKFDLMVLGKKNSYPGSGILSGKLARLTDCDILFMPEIAHPSFQHILLALDFSSYSDKVIRLGQGLQAHTQGLLQPLHVIKVGMQYFPYIKDHHILSKHREDEALNEYKRFQKKYGIDSKITFLQDNEQHISRQIYNQAIFTAANLIIVGNKGKKDEGDLLIGSVAEQLIASDKSLPIWIVK